MGKLYYIFCTLPTHCPSLGLLYFATATAEVHCRATAPAVTPAPPTEGMHASVGTYTLRQSVSENSALLFFYQRILGCSFLPEGSTPQWEGGVVSALYVLKIRVQCCVLFFFWGRSRNFFGAYVHGIIYACSHICPDLLNF